MLTSHASFSQLLTSLEVCWLGNENENLRFALLTDFADSANEPSPESQMLLRQAIADTQALNRRYPSSRPRFYLLHRQPEWNPAEGTWMGYERKRGKLALLNNWLRHPGTQFVSVADMPANLYRATLNTSLPPTVIRCCRAIRRTNWSRRWRIR